MGREEPEGRQGPPADPVAVAREIALRQLSVRARSRSELEKAMAARGVPQDVADQVLDRFTELRLVDDAGLARDWVDSAERRLRSRRAIEKELRTKGVDAETIAESLAAADPEAEYRAALAVARKRLRALTAVEPSVCRRRLAGALVRRGFSPSLVTRVLSEVCDGDEETNDID